MPLIMVPYAARAETRFPECTHLVAVAERSDAIALAWHDGYIADAARAVYEGHRRNGLGIYDARTHDLVARLHTRHPINSIAFHSTRDEIALGTGAYDGGYRSRGELVIWNWRTNASHSELGENREVTHVEWRGDELVAAISPATDDEPLDAMKFALTPARAGSGASQSRGKDPRLDRTRGSPAEKAQPSEAFERYRELAAPRSRVTALEWLPDGRVAIGRADGPLLLWNPVNDRTQELSIDGNVVAMWRHPDHGVLLQVDARRSSSTLFAIAGDRLQVVERFATPHTCSVDRHGRILARSLNTKEQPNSKVLHDGPEIASDLGQYDVFNHFIRLDGGDELYFLQGTPHTSHEHKRLCAITTAGAVETRMAWDGPTEHVMSSIGTFVGDGHLARAFLIHNSRGSERGVIELCGLDGRSYWRHEISGGVAAIAYWQGCVVAGLLDGRFLALLVDTGKPIHAEPFVFGSSPAMVTTIAVHDEAIALGSIDGRVSIVTSR